MRKVWKRLYRTERLVARRYGVSSDPQDTATFALHLLRPGGPTRLVRLKDLSPTERLLMGFE